MDAMIENKKDSLVIKFEPLRYAGRKKVYYIPQTKSIVMTVDEFKKIEDKLIPIHGKKYFFEGEEYIILKLAEYYVFEKQMPPHFIVFRSYLSKLIGIIRSIAPNMIIKSLDDASGLVNITLYDDEVDLNIVKSGEFTLEDVACYGKPNRFFEMIVSYYNECKQKGIGWNNIEKELDKVE